MIVDQRLLRVDPPAPRHAEVEDEAVAAIGIDQPIFGPARKTGHRRPGQPLPQIDRHRPAQVGAVGDDAGQPLAVQHGGEAPDGGFDFGQFGHGILTIGTVRPLVQRKLGSVCPRHKARLGLCP